MATIHSLSAIELSDAFSKGSLSPVEAEHACPGNDPHNALPHIAFTVPWNLLEQPAASINWSFSNEGLPLGVQTIGNRFDDIGVLRVARLIETLRPAQRPLPMLH
jgi:aspartyl-tRNA(Asn)/glutamyl-tRNA(Gln) amidotransferase subunit A